MSIHHSAFEYVPQLRDKIIDPHASRFRFLDYKDIDQRAREAGYPEGWRRSDEEREGIRQSVLAGREGDIWVFAYGSLMWDPGFFFDEVRVGRASGYQRKFCLHMNMGRGSPDLPGLMAALDDGEYCDGLVFRITAEQVDHETAVIFRREMISHGYVAIFVPVETDQGPVEALTFFVNKDGDRYAGDLGLDTSAQMIATAKGINGTNIDYVDNLYDQLQLLGLNDPQFEELHAETRKYL